MPASTPTTTPSGMPSQGVMPNFTKSDRHRIAAKAEEGRVAERDHAAIAAQDVPGQTPMVAQISTSVMIS